MVINLQITNLIHYLWQFDVELINLYMLFFCYLAILIMAKFWQLSGLYSYTSIAIIAANLQILTATKVSWYSEPIALGTIVYTSTFLANDLITELYGLKAARRNILLSFATVIVFLGLMILNLAIKPNVELEDHFKEAYWATWLLFTPNVIILTASLIAYLLSQLLDIYLFAKIKNFTKSKYLFIRAFISLSIASLLDSLLFNSLAWIILNPSPISWHNMIYSYVITAYFLQLIIIAINTVVFYFIRLILNFSKNT